MKRNFNIIVRVTITLKFHIELFSLLTPIHKYKLFHYSAYLLSIVSLIKLVNTHSYKYLSSRNRYIGITVVDMCTFLILTRNFLLTHYLRAKLKSHLFVKNINLVQITTCRIADFHLICYILC